jgi:hypothetical protein
MEFRMAALSALKKTGDKNGSYSSNEANGL